MTWALVMDVSLAIGLLFLAWQALIGGSLLRGIIMFIVFGMVLAVAWAWLGSPDLAMAEAAIGAGVTGALILVAYWRLKRVNAVEPVDPSPLRSTVALVVAVLGTGLVAALGLASVAALEGEPVAGQLLNEALPATGIGNPITGVLIIFRNLDTLLEIAVVLAAYVAARAALGKRQIDLPVPSRDAPLMTALVTVIAPLAVLVAIYLLKAGGQTPGGAFQASALLAALGVMLVLAGRIESTLMVSLWLRLALIVGTLVFCLVGLGVMLLGLPLLAIPGTWAVYLIEAAMMVSIAITLVLLFAGSDGLKGVGR